MSESDQSVSRPPLSGAFQLVLVALILVELSGLLLIATTSAYVGISRRSQTAGDQAIGVDARSSGSRELHVRPDGQPDGDGSATQPLDLATALSKDSPARPGDAIWLREGTYRGVFESFLTGTEQAPIVVRQYPGERATIDSSPFNREALVAFGSWTWFWGFEVTNSDPERHSRQTGSWPDDMRRGGGITARGTHLKFINMVVHDTSGGFGIWAESTGTEASGNLVYYNGWYAPDRGHGHGIYTQNAGGAVRAIRDNIIFDQFSHGIHAFGSQRAFLDDIVLEGNVSFNNGSLSGDFTRDILIGGGRVAQNPVLRWNSTYGGAQTNLGYAAGCANGVVEDNYFVGTALVLTNCTPTLRRNVIVSHALPTPPEKQQPDNVYHDENPAGAVVRVLPSAYEPGRAHVVVYNWDHQDRVKVKLGAACSSPQAVYHVQDAQNFFGPMVAGGLCGDGTIELPMTGLRAAPPVGNVKALPRHSAPEFAVFVVLAGPGNVNTDARSVTTDGPASSK